MSCVSNPRRQTSIEQLSHIPYSSIIKCGINYTYLISGFINLISPVLVFFCSRTVLFFSHQLMFNRHCSFMTFHGSQQLCFSPSLQIKSILRMLKATGKWPADGTNASSVFLPLRKRRRRKYSWQEKQDIYCNVQSHRLNKSKPVQRRQTICNKSQYV